EWWEQYAEDNGATATLESDGQWWKQFKLSPLSPPEPVPEVEQAGNDAAIANLEPLPWELPADATELETLNSVRLRELYTGEPRQQVVDQLRADYESETDPERKREKLIRFQVEERMDKV